MVEQQVCILAILKTAVVFKDFNNKEIILSEGTKVCIDVDRNIGLCEGHHFDLFPHEYSLLN